MRIVAALGGKTLLGVGRSVEDQRAHIQHAARSLAPIARGNELIVTHGNGPEVAMVAAPRDARLDVLGARSAGMIGYLLQQALGNELPDRDFVTVLTEVMVDHERLLGVPTRPIGPMYPEASVGALATEHGWSFGRDGAAFRRLVATPEPREIVQIEAIRRLAASGAIVICAGGGGIPSMLDCKTGSRVGVDAVIDSDMTAALLAWETNADLLLILTDVDAVYRDFGTDRQRGIGSATTAELRAIPFAAGSMAPKVNAVCRFVDVTGKPAMIGALKDGRRLLDLNAGSLVLPCPPGDAAADRGLRSRTGSRDSAAKS